MNDLMEYIKPIAILIGGIDFYYYLYYLIFKEEGENEGFIKKIQA